MKTFDHCGLLGEVNSSVLQQAPSRTGLEHAACRGFTQYSSSYIAPRTNTFFFTLVMLTHSSAHSLDVSSPPNPNKVQSPPAFDVGSPGYFGSGGLAGGIILGPTCGYFGPDQGRASGRAVNSRLTQLLVLGNGFGSKLAHLEARQ